jgi:methionyl aminopeptidase
MIQLKSARELDRMREAGRHVGEIMVKLRELARPGVTTGELNEAAEDEIRSRGLKPSFLGYGPAGAPPYPAVLCTSVNEEIVHGIPGPRRLKQGDLLKLDCGVIFDGFHGDTAVSVAIGEVAEEIRKLQEATRSGLYAGVAEMVPGNRLGDISHAVQAAAEAPGFSVVRDFVGHGIGRSLHEPPQVPNFGRAGRGPRLRPGMVLAIEPMVNAGGPGVKVLENGWTASTQDDEVSCHYEHTVAVTDDGPEILTRVPGSH